MTEVLHANIFFFITGIAVIIFTALLCVALFHIIKVLKSMRRIMDRIEEGTEVIAEDMQQVRTYFTEGGLIAGLVRTFMGKRAAHGSSKKSSRKEHKKNELSITEE